MSYTLYITYKLPLIDVANEVPQVSPVFDLSEGNYSSDKSYTEANGDTVWNTKVIKNNNDVTSTRQVAQSVKSVYATNGVNYDPYDPEVYAHSDVTNPIPLYRFAKEIFPIATYDSVTDTYSAELTVNTPEENPFNKDDVDDTTSYYIAIAEVVPNITVYTNGVLFNRYRTASVADQIAVSQSVYMPQGDDLSYFVGLDNSEEVDPQPATLGQVAIDTSKGRVYQAAALNDSVYIAKTDNFVIAYSKNGGNPSMKFIYDDVVFVSSNTAPTIFPDNIIARNADGGWTCDEDSIILGGSDSEDLIFIGNNVTTPTT